MFQSVQSRLSQKRSAALVDIAPLIDIVFILLIFFLVTTTFVRDTGVEVTRPEAVTAQSVESTSMRVSIARSGAVYTDGREISLTELTSAVRQFMAKERQQAVLIIPDTQVPSGRLVEVMDAARLGGARAISVATRRPQ